MSSPKNRFSESKQGEAYSLPTDINVDDHARFLTEALNIILEKKSSPLRIKTIELDEEKTEDNSYNFSFRFSGCKKGIGIFQELLRHNSGDDFSYQRKNDSGRKDLDIHVNIYPSVLMELAKTSGVDLANYNITINITTYTIPPAPPAPFPSFFSPASTMNSTYLEDLKEFTGMVNSLKEKVDVTKDFEAVSATLKKISEGNEKDVTPDETKALDNFKQKLLTAEVKIDCIKRLDNYIEKIPNYDRSKRV